MFPRSLFNQRSLEKGARAFTFNTEQLCQGDLSVRWVPYRRPELLCRLSPRSPPAGPASSPGLPRPPILPHQQASQAQAALFILATFHQSVIFLHHSVFIFLYKIGTIGPGCNRARMKRDAGKHSMW